MRKKILAAFAGVLFAGALTAAAFLGKYVTATADEPMTEGEEKLPIPENHIGASWKEADREAAELGYTYLA